MKPKRKRSDALNTRRLSRLTWALNKAWALLWLCVAGFIVMIVPLLLLERVLDRESSAWFFAVLAWLLPMFGAVLALAALVLLGGVWLLERGLQGLEGRLQRRKRKG